MKKITKSNNQGVVNSYNCDRDVEEVGHSPSREGEGGGNVPGEARVSELMPQHSPLAEVKGDWEVVRPRCRIAKWKRLANWRDERSIVVWGVSEVLTVKTFAKVLQRHGLYELLRAGTVERLGQEDGKRIQVTLPSEKGVKMMFRGLEKILKRYGWHAVKARRYQQRVQDRGEEMVEKDDGEAERPLGGRYSVLTEICAQPELSHFIFRDEPHIDEDRVVAEAKKMKIATLNVCTMRNKEVEIAAHLQKMHIDLCAFQETRQDGKKAFVARGYRWYGKGNVGFFVSLALSRYVEDLSTTNEKWRYWIRVKGDSDRQDVYVGCVYMPQSSDLIAKQIFDELQDEYERYSTMGEVVLLGDFNAHVHLPVDEEEEVLIGSWGSKKERCANGVRLMSFLRSCSARSMNCRRRLSDDTCEYTRRDRCHGTEAVIDYVVAQSGRASSVGEARVDYTDLSSDHHLVVAEMSGTKSLAKRERIVVTKWRKETLTAKSHRKDEIKRVEKARKDFGKAVEEAMQGFEPSAVEPTANGIAAALLDWKGRVERAAHKEIGRKVVKKRFSQKWYDGEVVKATLKRRMAHKAYRKSGRGADHKIYRAIRREVKRLIARKKKKVWKEKMDMFKAAFDDHSKLFWSMLTELTGGRSAGCTGPIRDMSGVVHKDDKKSGEALADFYEELGKPVDVSPTIRTDGLSVKVGEEEFTHRYDDEFKEQVEEEVRGFAQDQSESDEHYERKFEIAEVKGALRKLKNGKATGGDGIPPEFLKYGGEHMARSLCDLFNCILNAGVTPAQWGKALVVLLYKKGDATDPGNYRGISLLDVVGKVYTKLVAARIEEVVRDEIVEEQAGFTDKRGASSTFMCCTRWCTRGGRWGRTPIYSSWTFGKHSTQCGEMGYCTSCGNTESEENCGKRSVLCTGTTGVPS